jgi:alginate O-acetyltransferase complex protein AlgI
MVFSSEIFLFTFLPLFLVAYYCIPFAWRSGLIVLASYVFYGWWRADFLLLLIGMTLWVYGFGAAIHKVKTERVADRLCFIGVAGCLCVLGVFKYLNFFVDSFAAMLGKSEADLGFTLRVILPIGISFFVFHAISYLVDIRRKEVPPADNLLDFAAFIALFPHLVAGPVLRYKDLSAQLRQREHSFALFTEGLRWFIIGLAKKVLIADAVAPLADSIFNLDHPTFLESWTGAVAYTVQLYFDFSGYSEMAVGLGLMIGIRFIQNFNFPYTSRSITEFWRRWHISLSVWLRDYLYIPLGGNRKGPARTYINLFLTMFIGGLWHGANWTFVIWGAYHGGLIAIERLLGIKTGEGQRSLMMVPVTMLLVTIGWVMFRAPNFGVAFDMYSGMAGLHGFGFRELAMMQLSGEGLFVLMLGIALIILESRLAKPEIPSHAELKVKAAFVCPAFATSALAGLCLLRISEQSFSPFLYFQF